jgi:hypothetical protein
MGVTILLAREMADQVPLVRLVAAPLLFAVCGGKHRDFGCSHI